MRLIRSQRAAACGLAGPSAPRASSSCSRLRCQARKQEQPLQSAITTSRHALSDGSTLEVLSQFGLNFPQRPPIVFVHGAGHGAWCWADKFMPWFAAKGYDVYAVSMRGHGLSDVPEMTDSAGTLVSNAEDLASVITGTIPGDPILVGHSFGGLIAQRYLLGTLNEAEQFCGVAGFAFLGSVPPSGSGKMVPRFLRRSPFKSLMATASLISKNYKTNLGALQLLFFSDHMPSAELTRLQSLFIEFDPATRLLDLPKLADELPLPALPEDKRPPSAVIGFADDRLVDREGCEELAEYLGTEAMMVEGVSHDGMLDTRWEAVAEALLKFCDQVAVDAAAPADKADYVRA